MKPLDFFAKPVLLIAGQDAGLLRRHYRRLRSQLAEREMLEDAENFTGNSSPADWIASASTMPFIAERRVVIVRQVFLADKKKLETADWSQVPESGLLVLVGDMDVSDSDKLKTLKSQSDSLAKAVTKAGGQVLAVSTEGGKGSRLIQDTALELGKKISPKSCDLLLEMVGGHLGDALDGLEKLAAFTGDEESIRESDIVSIVVPAREWNVFNLTDAAASGNAAAALRQLKTLMAGSGSLTEAAIRSLLPMLSRQMSLLWQAKTAIEGRHSLRSPSSEFLDLLPERPRITEVSEYRASLIMNSARKVQFDQLARCMQLITDADAELKGILPSFSPADTLERLVVQMATVFSEKKPASRAGY